MMITITIVVVKSNEIRTQKPWDPNKNPIIKIHLMKFVSGSAEVNR